MSPFRNVVLCADDFGLSDGVSRGIVELAQMGRISATGAMTNMPGWKRNAAALLPLKDRIGVGLHLNLTTGIPLGKMSNVAADGKFPTIGGILGLVLKRALPQEEVAQEIHRQLDAFEEAFKAPPAFIDGHQHVHVLPVVRQALFRVLEGRGYDGSLWLRDPHDRLAAILRRPVGRGKALIMNALASGFNAKARISGFGINDGFSGFAPFDLSIPPERIFATALSDLGPSPVVMCHPGFVDDELRGLDPAVESRVKELEYLKSDAFGALLEERGVKLVPRIV